MNKLTKGLLVIIGLIAIFYLVLTIPAPLSKEQIEFDEAVFTAQRLKANGKCQNALDILNTLEEEFPSTSIYLELEKEGCYQKLNQTEKVFDSCLNSKLTEYMPARAALCSKQLANAGKFEEALSIWDKNIQDKPEKIFPYSNINKYEQWRTKANLTIKSFFTRLIHPDDITPNIKAQSIANIQAIKDKKSSK